MTRYVVKFSMQSQLVATIISLHGLILFVTKDIWLPLRFSVNIPVSPYMHATKYHCIRICSHLKVFVANDNTIITI